MAHRVLDLLEAHPEYYAQMDALAKRLADGIRALFAQRGLPYAVVQHESIVDFKFRAGAPNRNYDDAVPPTRPRTQPTITRCRARHPSAAVAERSDVRLNGTYRRRH